MKNIKSLLMTGALAAVLALTSCGDAAEQAASSAVDKQEHAQNELATRSLAASKAQKAAAVAEYSLKSLATFEKGNAITKMTDSEIANIATMDRKNLRLVVLYESTAPWASGIVDGDYTTTGDDKLNGLLQSYDLSIVKNFELDEMSNGLVLEPNSAIDDPIEATREISLVDYVMMVHLKEPAQNTPDPGTQADNGVK